MIKAEKALMTSESLVGSRSDAKRSSIVDSKALLHRVITAVLVLFALWSAFVIVYPVVGNGWMYNLKQPVAVVAVMADAPEPRVLLSFDRYSMWTMPAIAHRELHCDAVQRLISKEVVLHKGRMSLIETLPFLRAALNGNEETATCCYVGALTYWPFGDYGPKIIYTWRSEEFLVGRGLAK